MSKTFCPIPWIFQAVRSNGDLRVCCQANISNTQGVLRKADGSSFNAGSDDLALARDAELMRSVRQSILEGKWHSSCTRCQQEEEAGLNSRRKYENEQWDFSYEDALTQTTSDGALNNQAGPLSYYDLRFGNQCNLSCRMCGPTDSSAWYSDWVKLEGRPIFYDTSGEIKLEESQDKWKTNAYDWHFSPRFWEQLEANLPHIKHIYMAGGEPLLIERHYEFLQKCVDSGHAHHITLEYNTNLTLLPDKVLTLWQSFKQVRIGASIDGFGEILEYQRYPAKWDIVYKNLQKLNQQPDNILPWLAYTVTTYNIFHTPDFILWKLRESGLNNINRTKRRPTITHHVAHNPKHLNIRVLPAALKDKVEQKFQQLIQEVKISNFSPEVISSVEGISQSLIQYMNATDYHHQYWKHFCEYTNKLDKMRGQDLASVEPEYRGYL